MWAEAMQRRDDEYRRMWSDEKIRIQQVVDEYRRRTDQDVARLQEVYCILPREVLTSCCGEQVVDEFRRRCTEESNLLKQMLERSDAAASLTTAPLPNGMTNLPGEFGGTTVGPSERRAYRDAPHEHEPSQL